MRSIVQIFSTNLAQQSRANSSVERISNQYSCLTEVLHWYCLIEGKLTVPHGPCAVLRALLKWNFPTRSLVHRNVLFWELCLGGQCCCRCSGCCSSALLSQAVPPIPIPIDISWS